jgi:hypothetical protein
MNPHLFLRSFLVLHLFITLSEVLATKLFDAEKTSLPMVANEG